MVQARGETDLAKETIGAESGSELRVKDFHRNRASVPEILGEIDRCHPAAAKLPLD